MSGQFWHSDHRSYRTAISYITGREIHINEDENRFLILPACTREAVRLALHDCRQRWDGLSGWHQGPSPKRLRPFLSDLSGMSDHTSFGAYIDLLFNYKSIWLSPQRNRTPFKESGWHSTDKTRILEFFLALWRRNAIAFPQKNPFTLQTIRINLLGHAEAISDSLIKAGLSPAKVYTINNIYLRRSGIIEIGDLTPEVIGSEIDKKRSQVRKILAVSLLRAQTSKYGADVVTHSITKLISETRKLSLRGKDGTDFVWVLATDRGLEQWRALCEKWFARAKTNRPGRILALNRFLDHLVERPGLPRDPKVFLDRHTNVDSVKEIHALSHNHLFEFLERLTK